MSYNFTVHECWGESDAYNFSHVSVTLSGSLRNYTIVKTPATPVEEDSTYTISLTATKPTPEPTGERSEATSVTVTTYTAS